MPLSLIQSTPPSTDPVTLAEAKAFAKVSGTADDTRITNHITVATHMLEDMTRRQFMDATYILRIDDFPKKLRHVGSLVNRSIIRLPRAPLDSVTSITYQDTADATQTLADTVYNVDTTSEPGRVVLANDQDWPDTLAEIHAVAITYVAGYGAASDVPEDLKTGIKIWVKHMLDWGEAIATSCPVNELPFSLQNIIDRYKLPEAA